MVSKIRNKIIPERKKKKGGDLFGNLAKAYTSYRIYKGTKSLKNKAIDKFRQITGKTPRNTNQMSESAKAKLIQDQNDKVQKSLADIKFVPRKLQTSANVDDNGKITRYSRATLPFKKDLPQATENMGEFFRPGKYVPNVFKKFLPDIPDIKLRGPNINYNKLEEMKQVEQAGFPRLRPKQISSGSEFKDAPSSTNFTKNPEILNKVLRKIPQPYSKPNEVGYVSKNPNFVPTPEQAQFEKTFDGHLTNKKSYIKKMPSTIGSSSTTNKSWFQKLIGRGVVKKHRGIKRH
jgi:hypothetical protein